MKVTLLKTVLLPFVLSASAAVAQTGAPPMQGMSDEAMPGMNQGQMPGMDHESMPGHGGQDNKPAEPAQKGTTQRPGVRAKNEIAMPGLDMATADKDIFYQVLFDQLEYLRTRNDRDGLAWEVQAWVGRDYDKLWLKSEGERIGGTSSGRVEALWSHAVAAFWDVQLGVRHDFGSGPSRQWLAVGVQGLAPYLFDVDATAYVGPSGRTAARFGAEYSFRLTQKAFLTPEIETSLHGKSDRERGIGRGFSDVLLGLRLRYEIRREIAPYVGISWGRKLGQTADFAREAGEPRSERQLVAGVRLWF